jgi:DNA topoisomerase-1
VSWNKVFATLPKSTTLETVSLEEAIRLIEDKIASGATPGKKTAKKAPAKKAAAKKPAAKKPAAKKPVIEESDETPFEGGAPVKKPAAKKPAATKKAAAK